MNDKPGNPSQGDDGTAEVNIYRETVGFRAHIEYRGAGVPADIPLDADNLRGAERLIYRHMRELGYEGAGARWHWHRRASEIEPLATRLFRKTTGTPS